MNLRQRIELMVRLGDYMQSPDPSWALAKEKASYENGWFIPRYIDQAVRNIVENFLQRDILEKWAGHYGLNPVTNPQPKQVGIVMAGNIPLVGFHDLLCVFISGHIAVIKPSSKDTTLLKQIVAQLWEWDQQTEELVRFADLLRNCDAYIATGSNNSAGYFEYYFKKYPHIIRRNRTSVAILSGKENKQELERLADDVHLYFGLGCRNVTKIFVPVNYDFEPLLNALKKYAFLADHHKYSNNYDYNLAILLLSKKQYMSSGSVLLVEDAATFSPISQLNYEFYENADQLFDSLKDNTDIQCVAGERFTPLGESQSPSITDYADRVDTMQFLANL